MCSLLGLEIVPGSGSNRRLLSSKMCGCPSLLWSGHMKQLHNWRLCCQSLDTQGSVGGGRCPLWSVSTSDACHCQAQAGKSQACLLYPLLAHLLTEYTGLHGPRGWQVHKMEGNSALIHHLVESHPPMKHTYVELLGEGERN